MSSLAIRRAVPANPLTGSVATAQVFTNISNPLSPNVLSVPGKLAIEGRKFSVRAEGNALTVGAYTFKPTLLGALTIPGTPLTAANWTTLGSGTARAIATTWGGWYIEADLIFDSQSGILSGSFSQLVNNLFDARAALAATLTGINGSNVPVLQGATTVPPADPVAYLAVAGTFGTAGLNVANLMNFEIGF